LQCAVQGTIIVRLLFATGAPHMRTYLSCAPCLAHQAHEAVSRATDVPAVRERILRRAFAELAEADFSLPPPVLGRRIHELVQEEIGDPDPYRADKVASNRLALRLADELEPAIAAATDPFAVALALAIAANAIDLGAKGHHDVTEDSITRELRTALERPLDAAAVDELRSRVAAADEVLYLCDNAGEVVFDKLLIARLPCPRVTAAVRGRPIINDATLDDATEIGLEEVAKVISNGDGTPGTVLANCSQEFRERFRDADAIISKGQGNYETLSGERRPGLFFLLRVKCPTVAADLDCRAGDLVVAQAGAVGQ
jgi:uncharacterized protein with ATP-grasp and redox domains